MAAAPLDQDRTWKCVSKKMWVFFSLLSLISSTAHSAEQTPRMLVQAAQCLNAKDFLPSLKASGQTFGYILDSESYPGDKVLYVVDYSVPHRLAGMVFVVVYSEGSRTQAFNIQNNAGYVWSRKGTERVDFVDPPLGGSWTQEHMISAIKKIQHQRKFVIPAKDLLVASADVRCESYTDSK